ncbi:radical SAM family heme chaperone HemW [Tautonia sociabilis]|uniref:Heme chaperone HemW n=1 Tax=Tautonia sociabilis TaxID=2080755 RepID=A0A432MJW8_9BACT|nr:radical SAM family heme chaperone HemW [Tautonia sociabilis]RUL87691.1 radical SAM family heme chaperone HemW [Tautonia sociabilis]
MTVVLAPIDRSCPADPPWIRPRAAYIHIPFCAHKCGYCDFASLAGADHLANRYLDALAAELELALDGPRPVASLFIGGGTPTRLNADQLSRLLATIARWFPLLDDGEWTVEANPGTLDPDKVDALASGGVNRISLGAQSFQPSSLRALERNHDPDDVSRAVALIAPRFDRWSLDLIFGAPGSTLDQWRDDLDRALALGPSHLSCYGLVFEKGTSLWKRRLDGLVRPVDEEVEHAMYAETIDRLSAAGLLQYEISNFARPGHESRHNLVYWANDAYYGFGLGAARYVAGVRSVNTRDLPAYLRRIESGQDATGPVERLDPEARARETAVLMLRRTAIGIDREDFRLRTGFDLDALCGPSLRRSCSRGWLEDDGRRVRLTRSGLFLADTVMSDLL